MRQAGQYLDKLAALIEALRSDLGTQDLPFVAGHLGAFVEGCDGINEAITALPDRVRNTAWVSAGGLTDLGDAMHFDAASQRTLGERYAEKVLAMAYEC